MSLLYISICLLTALLYSTHFTSKALENKDMYGMVSLFSGERQVKGYIGSTDGLNSFLNTYNGPTVITGDGEGAAFVYDSYCIRRIFDGIATIIAGIPGSSGHRGGSNTESLLGLVGGMIYDKTTHTLYFSDYYTDSFNKQVGSIRTVKIDGNNYFTSEDDSLISGQLIGEIQQPGPIAMSKDFRELYVAFPFGNNITKFIRDDSSQKYQYDSSVLLGGERILSIALSKSLYVTSSLSIFYLDLGLTNRVDILIQEQRTYTGISILHEEGRSEDTVVYTTKTGAGILRLEGTTWSDYTVIDESDDVICNDGFIYPSVNAHKPFFSGIKALSTVPLDNYTFLTGEGVPNYVVRTFSLYPKNYPRMPWIINISGDRIPLKCADVIEIIRNNSSVELIDLLKCDPKEVERDIKYKGLVTAKNITVRFNIKSTLLTDTNVDNVFERTKNGWKSVSNYLYRYYKHYPQELGVIYEISEKYMNQTKSYIEGIVASLNKNKTKKEEVEDKLIREVEVLTEDTASFSNTDVMTSKDFNTVVFNVNTYNICTGFRPEDLPGTYGLIKTFSDPVPLRLFFEDYIPPNEKSARLYNETILIRLIEIIARSLNKFTKTDGFFLFPNQSSLVTVWANVTVAEFNTTRWVINGVFPGFLENESTSKIIADPKTLEEARKYLVDFGGKRSLFINFSHWYFPLTIDKEMLLVYEAFHFDLIDIFGSSNITVFNDKLVFSDGTTRLSGVLYNGTYENEKSTENLRKSRWPHIIDVITFSENVTFTPASNRWVKGSLDKTCTLRAEVNFDTIIKLLREDAQDYYRTDANSLQVNDVPFCVQKDNSITWIFYIPRYLVSYPSNPLQSYNFPKTNSYLDQIEEHKEDNKGVFLGKCGKGCVIALAIVIAIILIIIVIVIVLCVRKRKRRSNVIAPQFDPMFVKKELE